PHTRIIEGLTEIATQSTRWGEKAADLLNQYQQKKDFYTRRIAELEATQVSSETTNSVDLADVPNYPHTEIQYNIDRLRVSLRASHSPQRQERLDLLAAIESDYMLKREWFTALRDAVENFTA